MQQAATSAHASLRRHSSQARCATHEVIPSGRRPGLTWPRAAARSRSTSSTGVHESHRSWLVAVEQRAGGADARQAARVEPAAHQGGELQQNLRRRLSWDGLMRNRRRRSRRWRYGKALQGEREKRVRSSSAASRPADASSGPKSACAAK